MKKVTLIFTFIFIILFLTGCTNKTEKAMLNNFSFDIDVNNLNYSLPNYTKLCIPDRKEACSIDGCEDIQPNVFLVFDETKEMIYRCDNKPCDGYNVKINQSGFYTYVEPVESYGFTVKISNDNEYVETVSIGLVTLISYGTCK